MSDLKKEFLSYIKSGQLKIKSRGSSKYCLETPQKPYVYLANIRPASMDSVCGYANNVQRKVQLSKQFKELGIGVVKIIGGFNSKGRYVEVQEKAQGQVFAINSPLSAYVRFIKPEEKTKPREEQNILFILRATKYNLQMQKILAAAPQEHYNKLISDYLKLKKIFNIDVVDNNSENVLYDPNIGFTLIDLDYNPGKHFQNEFDVFSNALETITDGKEMVEAGGKLQEYLKNNKQILIKMITAAKKNKIDFIPFEIEYLQEFAKENSLPADHPQILNAIEKLNLIFGRNDSIGKEL